MSIHSISQTIDRALAAAGLNTGSGVLKDVRSTIDKAWASAGLAPLHGPAPGAAGEDAAPVAAPGQFLTRFHGNGLARRTYKLYVPASHAGGPAPLIVMLHGCQQNPDDFALGTRMNEQAEQHGFLVAYPAQTARENGANCWNWFDSGQQRRDGTEPSLIAGIVHDIGQAHAVDPARVFVAGLSAGAAMAVILGTAYPELFAGVAAHSGLPIGAAHDMGSALAAMQGRAAPSNAGTRWAPMPTIVFHGDADRTVTAANGRAIVEQAVGRYARSETALHKTESRHGTPDGRTFTTTAYADAGGTTRVEQWVVHGGSHAWFGGSPAGSFTDASGPDASARIVRFFLDQPARRPAR